ncbi:MAG: hypothetical protein ACK47B_22635 [Armatimonadota bacterium]
MDPQPAGTSVPDLEPKAQLQSRRFALCFVSCFLLGVGLFAGLNWAVNPWGLYSPKYLPPRVADDAGTKCELLRARQPAPQQLVLGSSRVMRFEPRYLQARTGLPTFNAAVAAGGPVDALAMLRYSREVAGAPVRRVLIGLDMLSFFGRRGNYARLKRHPQLGRFVARRPDDTDKTSDAALLLSPAQAYDSFLSLRNAFFPSHAAGAAEGPEDQGAAPRGFEPDGFRGRYTDVEKVLPPRAFARYVEPALARAPFNPQEDLPNPVVLAELDALLDYLKTHRIEAELFTTPAPTPMRKHWKETGYLAREQELVREIGARVGRRGLRFHDFSAVGTFAGHEGGWYDPVHPMTVNSRRLVDKLFPAPAGGTAVDDAAVKLGLLRRLRPLPQQLILGSSRVMRFEPRYLQARTGLRTFNAAVAAGGPIDALALYRYAAEELGAPIKRVLIGVDVLSFFGQRGNYRRLVYSSALGHLIPPREGVEVPPPPLPAPGARPAPAAAPRFERDGYRGRYGEPDTAGKLFLDPFHPELETIELNPPEREPNPHVARELEALLELLRERRVKATLFLTPAPAAVRERWQVTGFAGRYAEVAALVAALSRRHGAEFFDLTDTESFDGLEGGWYDPMHPTVANTRRMLNYLVSPHLLNARAL